MDSLIGGGTTVETLVPPDLKEIISALYAIGELVDCEQLHTGYVNVSFIIETVSDGETNRYFLRKYRKGIKEEEIEFEHSVIKHLTKKNFHLVAGVISARDGKTYVKRFEDGDGNRGEGDFYALFDLLPGEDRYTWVNPNCNDEELKGAAAVLAQFHEAVFGFIPEGKRYEPKIIELLPGIAGNVRGCAVKAGKTVFDVYFLENLDHILEAIKRIQNLIGEEEFEEMVQLVIHCDYHPGNLKFQNDGITGLFDFDWSKVDARCFDVALAITYSCTAWEGVEDGDLLLDKAAVFLNAYQNTLKGTHGVGPMSGVELKYLPNMIDASNIYVLNWAVGDFYSKELDPHEYLIYLRHGVRVMRWLENRDNWGKLAKMITDHKDER